MFTKLQASLGQARRNRGKAATDDQRKSAPMALFKPDFYRMFAVGFVAGALFVFSTMDTGMGERIANGVVPVAEAQAAQ